MGIGIEVSIPNQQQSKMIKYYGEYVGHGKSKTVFALHGPGKYFHGKILKLSKSTTKSLLSSGKHVNST